jgi:hypothetical protein
MTTPGRGSGFSASLGLDKIFWRTRLIASLPQYPEKTDRLVQRQGGGETPRQPLSCRLMGSPAGLFSGLN